MVEQVGQMILDLELLGNSLLTAGIIDEAVYQYVFVHKSILPRQLKSFLIEGSYLEEYEFFDFIGKLYNIAQIGEDDLVSIDEKTLSIIPLPAISRHLVVPYRVTKVGKDQVLHLAVENPFKFKIFEKLAQKWELDLVLVSKDVLLLFLEKRFGGKGFSFFPSAETEQLQQRFSDLLMSLIERDILTKFEVLTKVKSL